MSTYTYFEIEECPLAYECNEKNFNTWKVWGSTPNAARERCVAHLLGCGHHKEANKKEGGHRDEDFYVQLVEQHEPVEKTHVESQAKRQRTDWTGSTGAAASGHQELGSNSFGNLSIMAARPKAAGVMLNRQEYKEIVDGLERAAAAAGNAKRLASAAASAFGSEQAVFLDVKKYMEAKLEIEG